MNWKTMLAFVTAASTLVACGGESDSKAPDININVEVIEVVGPEQPEDNITNTPLPVIETFDAVADAPAFFSASYAALASESASDDEDNFYHSTAGVFQADGSLDPEPGAWITGDIDPHFRLGNARFTVGQIVSVHAEDAPEEPRKNSTPGSLPDASTSWGELDLSSLFTVSFCVVDRSEGGNFFIYVDNNSTSSGNSIHGSASRAVNVPQSSFTAGQRASFDIEVGTPNSFIQLRSDSGGWLVLDDLVIENAANSAGAQPDCSVKTTTFGTSPDGDFIPTAPPVAAPANLTLTAQPERLDVSWDALDDATEYDLAYNTNDSTTGATVIADIADTTTTILGLTAGTDYFVFVRGSNSEGDGPYSASASAQALAVPEAVDFERTWSNVNGELNEAVYGSALTETPPTTSNNSVVNPTDTTVNGLHLFLSADNVLRHRGSNNQEFNFNGSAYANGTDETTNTVGTAADELRAYIGVPVDPDLAVDIVVNHRNSSSGVDPAVRIVFIGATSGNVLCAEPASSDVAANTTCSLPASHGESEVRFIYSREGQAGGMHVSSIDRYYPATDRTWSSDNGAFNEATYTSILSTPPPTTGNNSVVNPTDTTINGLHLFLDADNVLRHRGGSANEFNFNGSAYAAGTDETTEAIGATADALRAYIGVPVDPALAVDIVVNHRNSTGGGADAGVRIVFIGATSGNVLCVEPASSDTAADTTCSLAAAHGESEVRIIYSREGGNGGMHVNSITRTYL